MRLTAALLALLVALFLAACGSDSDDSGGSGEGGGSGTATDLELFELMEPAPGAETVDTSGFAPKNGDTYKIGFSDVSLVNSWRVQSRRTAEIKAEEWGVDLIVTDAEGDAKKQIADIEDLLSQNIDALVVSPVAPEPIAPVVERAASSGIPVIIWSGKVDTDQYTSQVVADDVQFGVDGGKFLCSVLDKGSNVIALRGIAGITVETDRYEGAKKELDNCGIKIVGEEYGDWAFDKGKQAAENLLAAHSDIDGVWSSGADMTRGAIQAFREAGRELVPMTGEALNGFLKIWQKRGLSSVAPVYPTWMGAEAVKLAILALQNKEIVKDYRPASPPITDDTLAEHVKPDLPDDYWLDDGYLTDEQLAEIFDGSGGQSSSE
jgi:ribose transport system substrate-binding protein